MSDIDTEFDEDTSVTSCAEEAAEAPELLRGSNVGRYVIIDFLGQGGMGTVYQAFDPELSRPVALKLVRLQRDKSADTQKAERHRDRLLREAQALAQLSHPNVVAVYDVGIHEDAVFIAMEYVEGQALSVWLKDEGRSRAEVMEKLLAAGQGLAAAHRVGIIHRDFKPANVVVGKDGRARVLDFGLARALGVEREQAGESPEDAQPEQTRRSESGEHRQIPNLPVNSASALNSSGSLFSSSMTQAGAIMGTVRYMAPEQMDGKPGEEKTDQFSFCVTVYEALCRRRPFKGKNIRELHQAIKEDQIRSPAAERMPPWLMAIVRRGLSFHPADRYQSMEELLQALADDPTVARREVRAQRLRWLVVAGGILMGMAIGGFGLWYGTTKGTRFCSGAEQNLAGLWDEASKRKIAQAFAATQHPSAQATFARIESLLDQRTSAWVALRTEACEATHVKGEQSETLLDLRMRCLNRRLSELQALVKLFGNDPDQELVTHSVPAVFKLKSLDACSDEETLTAAIAPPDDPNVRVRVKAIRGRLDEVDALRAAGKYPDGLTAAQQTRLKAKKIDYPPVLGEALVREGQLLDKTGQYRQAEAVFQKASTVALSVRDRVTAIEALLGRLWIATKNNEKSIADGLALGRLIETVLDLGEDDDILRANLYNHLGVFFNARADYEDSIAQHKRALAIRLKALGENNLYVAYSYNNIGLSLYRQRKYDQAIDYHQRSLAIKERVLGPDHPSVATSLNNLGIVFSDLGDFQQSKTYQFRALAIRKKIFGQEHPYIASSFINLCEVCYFEGRLREALDYCSQALIMKKKILGPAHPTVATTITALGQIFFAQGKVSKALAHYQQAQSMLEKLYGPAHPDVAASLTGQGKVYRTRGETKKAEGFFVRVIKLCDENKWQDETCALARSEQAKILFTRDRDCSRGPSMARQARDTFSKIGRLKKYLNEVEHWLGKARAECR